MRKVTTLVLLALTALFTACDDRRPQGGAPAAGTSEAKTVFVLFDYSKSLDTTSIQTTASRAAELVQRCQEGMTLKFIPINNDPFAQPVFSYTRAKKPGKPRELAQWERQNQVHSKQIAQIITELHRRNNMNSCIANGFATVYNHVKTLPAGGNLHLVVLSDMLECCDNAACAQSAAGFGRLLTQLDRYNFGAIPLSRHIPLGNVSLVINSTGLPRIRAIYNSPGREFYQFWEAVAKGMGYDQAFATMPGLPD